jgi:hypothetical protein
MPKTNIDYSNTIIYKIFCNDETVTDLYVGHTTNFVQRKSSHKISCTHEKHTNYNCKLYKIIRANGGWTNWTMEIVNFFNCKTHTEARIKEQEYFLLLKATLNSIEPFPEKIVKENVISEKIVKTKLKCKTEKHINKLENIITNNEDTTTALISTKFNCKECAFTTEKKCNYEEHLLTKKHKNNTTIAPVEVENKIHMCLGCNKVYKSRVGLWYHNKNCMSLINKNKHNLDTTDSKNEQITHLITIVTELQKQLAEFVINK